MASQSANKMATDLANKKRQKIESKTLNERSRRITITVIAARLPTPFPTAFTTFTRSFFSYSSGFPQVLRRYLPRSRVNFFAKKETVR